MDSSRRDIEMELKRVLKLCQWDHRESAIENFTSTRQKLRKIIKKYTVSNVVSILLHKSEKKQSNKYPDCLLVILVMFLNATNIETILIYSVQVNLYWFGTESER